MTEHAESKANAGQEIVLLLGFLITEGQFFKQYLNHCKLSFKWNY
jgi:hypothetical protein